MCGSGLAVGGAGSFGGGVGAAFGDHAGRPPALRKTAWLDSDVPRISSDVHSRRCRIRPLPTRPLVRGKAIRELPLGSCENASWAATSIPSDSLSVKCSEGFRWAKRDVTVRAGSVTPGPRGLPRLVSLQSCALPVLVFPWSSGFLSHNSESTNARHIDCVVMRQACSRCILMPTPSTNRTSLF